MKRLTMLWGLMLCTLFVRAQQDYFIFFQSEDNRPYYIQMGEKTFSSSLMGHLIISGLKDSTYVLNVGFPKDKSPERLFQVRLNKKDAGFQLKNMGADGWGLSNLQTLQLIKAQPVESRKQTIAYGDVKKTDVFSTLMAGLVNDSAVLYTSIAKVEPANGPANKTLSGLSDVKNQGTKENESLNKDSSLVSPTVVKQDLSQKDTAIEKSEIAKTEQVSQVDTLITRSEAVKQEQSKIDTLVNNNTAFITRGSIPDKTRADSLKGEAAQASTKPEGTGNKETKPGVVLFSETKTSIGAEMVFIDMSSPERIDTIRILIPVDHEALQNASKKSTGVENRSVDSPARKKENVDSSEKDSNNVNPARNTNEAASQREKGDNKQVEKKGLRNFFGKLFRRNADRPEPEADKAGPEKTSSIKVIDLEKEQAKKARDTVNNQGRSKREVSSREAKRNSTPVEKDSVQKPRTGKFFGNIFSKKNNPNDSLASNSKAGQRTASTTRTNPDQTAQPSNSKKVTVTNSDCREFANDADVDRLRTRMLGEKDADGQVNEARKFFKAKCFSTKQIKTLSEFFRTDEGKYKLFDAAYPFVSDTNNFRDLAELLSEEYYINRFKAMVRR